MEYIEILENNRPWDCEVFPKSKTICYGGGNPITKVIKKVTDPIHQAGTPNIPSPNIPAPNLPEFNDPIQNINLNPSQGNLDSIAGIGEGVTAGLEKNVGLDSTLGQNLQANVGGLREGTDHMMKQIGIGGQMIGQLFQNATNPAALGGGGGGAGGGSGVMGPASGGLARLEASKLQQKKAGMGRRQTYLTKA